MKKFNELYSTFFSILYFKYQKIGERKIPGFYAVCFLTILETFNVLSLIYFYRLISKLYKEKVPRFYCYLIVFSILGLNYIYFYVRKQKEIGILNFGAISAEKNFFFETYLIIYIVASVAVWVAIIAISRYMLLNY